MYKFGLDFEKVTLYSPALPSVNLLVHVILETWRSAAYLVLNSHELGLLLRYLRPLRISKIDLGIEIQGFWLNLGNVQQSERVRNYGHKWLLPTLDSSM